MRWREFLFSVTISLSLFTVNRGVKWDICHVSIVHSEFSSNSDDVNQDTIGILHFSLTPYAVTVQKDYKD